jgi:hypothetical protein
MGRIKTIEAELRKERAEIKERKAKWVAWCKIRDIEDPAKQTATALHYTGHSSGGWYHYKHPRAAELPEGEKYLKENETSLYSLLSHERFPITGAEAVALWFDCHGEPSDENEWTKHCELRLAYENQMLAAQGGMLEQFEVLPGGKLGGRLIIKVSKSSVTKRATSCDILGPKVSGWTYKAANIPGTEFAAYKFDLERIKPETYTPPTPESLAELAKFNADRKAKAPKVSCPLINPTEADAEKLQAIWNKSAKEPSQITKLTQAEYSDRNGSSCQTVIICETGREHRRRYGSCITRADVFKVRKQQAFGYSFTKADSVVVLVDKPQKPLLWDAMEAARAQQPTVESLRPKLPAIRAVLAKDWMERDKSKEDGQLLRDAEYVGWISIQSMTQISITDAGVIEMRRLFPDDYRHYQTEEEAKEKRSLFYTVNG